MWPFIVAEANRTQIHTRVPSEKWSEFALPVLVFVWLSGELDVTVHCTLQSVAL